MMVDGITEGTGARTCISQWCDWLDLAQLYSKEVVNAWFYHDSAIIWCDPCGSVILWIWWLCDFAILWFCDYVYRERRNKLSKCSLLETEIPVDVSSQTACEQMADLTPLVSSDNTSLSWNVTNRKVFKKERNACHLPLRFIFICRKLSFFL